MKQWWVCVAAVVLLLAFGASVWAAPAVTYVRMMCPADKSTVFLSFENNKMKVAKNTAGLASATAIKASDGKLEDHGSGQYYQWYTFTNVDLPMSMSGLSVKCNLTYSRSRYKEARRGNTRDFTSVSGDVTLTQKDANGVVWGYGISAFAQDDSGKNGQDAQHPLDISVPKIDPAKLTTSITTQANKREVQIGLKVKSGNTELSKVTKNGKNAPVTLDITDKNGKSVKKESGDLEKFGFT